VKRIRLAIVDDSTFVRKALQRLLHGVCGITVVGTAGTGEELLQSLEAWCPDVVSLDLSMPGMGGLQALDHILRWRRIPVIILSTHSQKDAPLTIEALHHGAVDFVDKQQYSLTDFEVLRSVLTDKILGVVGGASQRRGPKPGAPAAPPLPAHSPPKAPPPRVHPGAASFDALLIGASTGGPPAIQTLLEGMGPSLRVPVAVVQHMPAGFTRAFAQRLDTHLPFPVREASHGEAFAPGTVFIAPTGHHLRFRAEGARVRLSLETHPADAPHCPSVDALFASGAEVFGRRALAVLLTGMGRDGAEGMAALRSAGAHTIGQDEASCVVYGMPKAAFLMGAVCEQTALERVGPRVAELLSG
jgi:two-component system chemotaxis response regulator CheB